MNVRTLYLSLLFAGLSFAGNAQNKNQNKADTNPVSFADSIIFTKLDQPAEFPGGVQGWIDYLQKNLHYPNKALKKGIQGVVRVQFLVDREGNIHEVRALNDPGGGLMEEAVRIFKSSPKWIPGQQNGRPVIFRHVQDITFKLE
jgi:protein TonB